MNNTTGMRFFSTPLFILWKKELLQISLRPALPLAILIFLAGTAFPFLFPDTVYSAAQFTFRQYIVRLPLLSIILLSALTMNSWTDERKNGTDRVLFSLPVTDGILLAGKFLGPFTVYLATLVLTLPLAGATSFITGIPTDSGSIAVAYLLLVMYGAAGIAFGELLSLCFRSPVSALLAILPVLLVLNTSQLLPGAVQLPDWAVYVCTRLSFAWHFEAASRGILDSRDMLFYLFPLCAAFAGNAALLHIRRKHP